MKKTVFCLLCVFLIGCGENAVERYGGVIQHEGDAGDIIVNQHWNELNIDQKIDLVRALSKKHNRQVTICRMERFSNGTVLPVTVASMEGKSVQLH